MEIFLIFKKKMENKEKPQKNVFRAILERKKKSPEKEPPKKKR